MTELEKARKEINLIDSEIARLFAKRMDAVRGVAEYKKTHGLPVCDPLREEALLASVEGAFDNPVYAKYYRELLKKEIGLSKAFQHSLSGDLYVNTGNGGYEVVIACGGLDGLDKYLPNGIKTLVISDDGVPARYAEKVARYCGAETALFPQGEKNKTPETLKCLLQTLSKGGYDRASRVIAVGGGVVGDMAGLAASLYMRGIEFVNIPTTLLAQVDSCVGGKTGCDLDGVKNAFGTFFAPSKVIIDTETLQTLQRRHIANGLAEALKAALIGDPELFEAFENGDPFGISYETVIRRALKVKISVVEADEKESGLRRALNLGHTIGHGIESACGGGWLHGECVAVGMLPVCSPGLRARLIPIYVKLGLPESAACRADEVLRYCLNDKKAKDGGIITVRCDNPGEYRFVRIGEEELRALIKQVVTE